MASAGDASEDLKKELTTENFNMRPNEENAYKRYKFLVKMFNKLINRLNARVEEMFENHYD